MVSTQLLIPISKATNSREDYVELNCHRHLNGMSQELARFDQQATSLPLFDAILPRFKFESILHIMQVPVYRQATLD